MTNNGQTPGGNTTTAGAVEQLAMARRVYARFILDNVPGAGPDDVPKFDDNAHGVKIALAAIIETRAQIINSLRHDFDEWPDYVALADVADALEGKDES